MQVRRDRQPRRDAVAVGADELEAEDAVEAGGYASPVVEDGGTCTLRLRKDDETVVVTAEAVADATTTVCGGLRTAPGDLSAGRWTAVLEYASPSTEGSSAPVVVEVTR